MSTAMNTPANEPKCDAADLRDDLKAYRDGELPLRRRLKVRAHLAHCTACQKEMETMEKITTTLRASEDAAPPLPAALRTRLVAAGASAPTAETTTPAPLWRRPLVVFGTGGAALAASAFVFASLYSTTAQEAAGGSEATAYKQIHMAGVQYIQDYDEAFRSGVDSAQGTGAASAPGATSTAVTGTAAAGAAMPTSEVSAAAPRVVAQSKAMPVENARRFSQTYRARRVATARPVAGVAANMAADARVMDEAVSSFERQVHKDASLGIEVKALEATSNRIEEMVKAGGGFVASNNLSTDADGYKSADLSLRVPTKDFETTMASLAKLGNVVSKSVSGEDITEQVSDATSAEQVMANDVRETAEKLRRQPMSERRTGQKEAELRMLRIRLAQIRARLGLLRKMAALSTINVSLTEKVKKAQTAPPPQPGFWTDMRETNRAAAAAFQAAVRVPVVLLVWVLAFSPIWVPLIIAYRYASLKSLARAGFNAAAGRDGGPRPSDT
jgi:hypothetical protein